MKLNKIIYICILASLMCIVSPIVIPINNVGITLSIFIISLICSILNKNSFICIAIYIIIGLIGLPVFQGYSSGVVALVGPTGGFIIGYIFYSLITGILIHKLGISFFKSLVFNLIGLFICYCFGIAWFIYTTKVTFWYALTVIIIPYVLLDIIKIILAYIIYKQLKIRNIVF